MTARAKMETLNAAMRPGQHVSFELCSWPGLGRVGAWKREKTNLSYWKQVSSEYIIPPNKMEKKTYTRPRAK